MIDDTRLTALCDWLTAGALSSRSLEDVAGEICRRLVGAGLPIDMLGLSIYSINPNVLGTRITWTPQRGIRTMSYSHEQMAGPVNKGSIFDKVMSSRRMVRHRIGSDPEIDAHPSTQAFAERGYVEILALPLMFRHIDPTTFATATKHDAGFTEPLVTGLRRLQAPLARVVEASTLHENTVSVLSTYVGRNAGQSVLHGQIRRGDVDAIPAVILFADLVDFTGFSNAHPADAVIARLNRFYEALHAAIAQNSGEVLKLIGDGLLAVFPAPDDPTAQAAAAAGAMLAVQEARAALSAKEDDPPIAFRAALHVGDIHYGNIGSPTRLDFTAVGPTVNLAARLLSAAGELDADIVCSEEFRQLAPFEARPVGTHSFKGFEAPLPVFALPGAADFKSD